MLREAVVTWLRDMGYAHKERSGGTDIRFELRTRQDEAWRAQFLIDEDARLLRLFVFTEAWVLVDTPPSWLVEVACRASEKVVFGNLEFDWDRADVCYRASARWTHREVGPADVAEIANMAAFPLRLWSAVIARSVRLPTNTPAAIVNAVLLETGAYQRKFVRGRRQTELNDLFGSAALPSDP